MAIIFTTNSPEAFSLQPVRTTAYPRDPDYTAHSLRFPVTPSTGNEVASFANFAPPSGDVIWFHARISYPQSVKYIDNFFEFQDANNNAVARLSIDSELLFVSARGDTTVGVSGSGVSDYATETLDIKVEVNANITVEVYRDGLLDMTAIAANTGGKGVPQVLKMLHNGALSTGTSYRPTYSELIVDDADSTIGCRLSELLPASDGAHTDWSGTGYASLSDFDNATFLSASAEDAKQTWGLSAYGGNPSPTQVRAVVQEAFAQTQNTGPKTLTPMARISSVDYYGGGDDLGSGTSGLSRHVWATNPSTSTFWDISDLTSLETGYRADL